MISSSHKGMRTCTSPRLVCPPKSVIDAARASVLACHWCELLATCVACLLSTGNTLLVELIWQGLARVVPSHSGVKGKEVVQGLPTQAHAVVVGLEHTQCHAHTHCMSDAPDTDTPTHGKTPHATASSTCSDVAFHMTGGHVPGLGDGPSDPPGLGSSKGTPPGGPLPHTQQWPGKCPTQCGGSCPGTHHHP